MRNDIYCIMDKIHAVAAMFSLDDMDDSRILSVEASSGISLIMEDCSRDLVKIDQQNKKVIAWKGDREHRLEQFMGDMATEMEQTSAGDWNFKTAAANIRHVLKQ